jgi:glyoxylase-like metal-dependent hydrolase (beta-lactamase superfamily II)
MPKIKKLVVGFLDTNCYIISFGKKAVLIDPGENYERILKELEGLKLERIILTHLHFDHITAAKKIKEATGALILCHKADLKILNKDIFSEKNIDTFLKDREIINIGSWKFKIISTPGHTPGSICLYLVGANGHSPILFSGDTIFAGSIGVTNYPGGDFNKIKSSIEKKLLTLPDDVRVYPGHYRDFLLGEEKEAIKSILEQ